MTRIVLTDTIENLVATGPDGVKTVMTAINNFNPDHANLARHAKITQGNFADPAAFNGSLIWSLVVPNGQDASVDEISWIIPKERNIGQVTLDKWSLTPLNASNLDVTGGQASLSIYKNGVITIFASAMTVVGTTVSDSGPGMVTFDPGDKLSVRAVTNFNGNQTFDPVSVEIKFTVPALG